MSVYKIIFSPTGGTEKVARCVAQEFAPETKNIDLTDPLMDFHQITLDENDLSIIAVPSFSGRVPGPAAERLKSLHPNGSRAIIIAVYGNRAYEDTLLELKDLLTHAGFRCIAAIAAIAEHSILHKFAQGRPDPQDLQQLSQFAKQIRQHMEENPIPDQLILPGNNPYREYSGVPIKPAAKKDCSKCGICAAACPVQAIPRENPTETDPQKCISCMRCVCLCPSHSRKVNPILIALAAGKMKKVCSIRKQNELFL